MTHATTLRRPSTVLLASVVPVALIGMWQLIASAHVFSESQLPAPTDVARALVVMLSDGQLWMHLQASLRRVFLGFVCGATAGLILGSLVGLSATAKRLLGPTVGAIRTVPSLAWVPLLLLWFGIGEEPKVLLVAIGAFFPIYTTTASALAHVDDHLLEVGQAYGRHGARLLFTIALPAAAPELINGLRLGLANAWMFLVAAELIASSRGLGFLLIDSQNTGRTDVMLLMILLLAVLGKLTDTVLDIGERVVTRQRSNR